MLKIESASQFKISPHHCILDLFLYLEVRKVGYLGELSHFKCWNIILKLGKIKQINNKSKYWAGETALWVKALAAETRL